MKTPKLILAAFIALAFASSSYAECVSCPDLATRPTKSLSDYADNDGNLTKSVTITCDTLWTLDEKIYVLDGQTITIGQGTVVKAAVGSGLAAPALIVTRGGKINAVGTASCPIIFTSVEDNLDGEYAITNQGKWGGIIVLGKAYNNLEWDPNNSNEFAVGDGEGTIEGLDIPDSRHHYGRDWSADNTTLNYDFDDEDNSGRMSYVSIRHGGALIGDANEINGLTLGSVGSGTQLDHIEVISNADDGIEFFGGTACIKYVSVMFCDDDYLDGDLGWTGSAQFVFGLQLPEGAGAAYGSEGDNGWEIDGDDDNMYTNATLPAGVILTYPTVYNATIIGNGKDEGFEAKERIEGEYYNSIFCNFDGGLNLSTERTYDAYSNWQSGKLIVKNCIFGNNVSAPLKIGGAPAGAADLATFMADGNDTTCTGLDFQLDFDASTNTLTGGVSVVPAEGSVDTDILSPVGGCFERASYKGAFEPGKKPWIAGWTYTEQLDVVKEAVNCPNDTNGDGEINVTDFLNVLGQFGGSCAQ